MTAGRLYLGPTAQPHSTKNVITIELCLLIMLVTFRWNNGGCRRRRFLLLPVRKSFYNIEANRDQKNSENRRGEHAANHCRPQNASRDCSRPGRRPEGDATENEGKCGH